MAASGASAAGGSITSLQGIVDALQPVAGETTEIYIAFMTANAWGAAIVLSGMSLLGLTLDIEVMSALLLPLALGFLLATCPGQAFCRADRPGKRVEPPGGVPYTDVQKNQDMVPRRRTMKASASKTGGASSASTGAARHPEHGPSGINLEAVRRLKNIAGQVDGIRRMVEEEKYCIDILTQVSAVRAALNSVGLVILKRHIEHCVTDAIESGGENKQQVIDELMAVFARGHI